MEDHKFRFRLCTSALAVSKLSDRCSFGEDLDNSEYRMVRKIRLKWDNKFSWSVSSQDVDLINVTCVCCRHRCKNVELTWSRVPNNDPRARSWYVFSDL